MEKKPAAWSGPVSGLGFRGVLLFLQVGFAGPVHPAEPYTQKCSESNISHPRLHEIPFQKMEEAKTRFGETQHRLSHLVSYSRMNTTCL